MAQEQRRLAAIVAADVAGYSRLMGADESGTLAALKALRRDVVDPVIASHNGRVVKTTGDGLLLEFASVVDAVRCALKVQGDVAAYGIANPEERRIAFRIGINLGDVIIDGDDIFGDGVNIAARLEGIAEPGGICLSDDAVRQVRGKIDAPFYSLGPQALKNIALPIHVWRWLPGQPSHLKAPALALPDKPSIAVLPFQNMSGDPEQEYFADGIVEDIITALSRFKSLFVIARNASFTYKGKTIDIRAAARELGVRYVLEGSVRKAGNQVRITGQLIDAVTLAHVWADRFDGLFDDIFALQDQITASVVTALVPKLDEAEIERAKRKPVERLDAYDWFLRGMAKIYYDSGFSRWDIAMPMFARAMELAPEFATPYGVSTRFYTARKFSFRTVDKGADETEVRRLAARVRTIGKDDALALCWAGHSLLVVCGDHEAARMMVEQAIAANPNLGDCWHTIGSVTLCVGEHETTIEHLQRALKFNPLGPDMLNIKQTIGAAHFFLGRYEEALRWANGALMHIPNHPVALQVVANAHAMMGNRAEAARIAETACSIYPAMSLRTLEHLFPWKRNVDQERWVDALRAAGFPG